MSSPTTLAGPTPKVSWPKRQVAKLKTKLRQKYDPNPPSNAKTDIDDFLNPPSPTVNLTSASNAIPRQSVAEEKREIPATSEESKAGEDQDVKTNAVEKSVAQGLARRINERARVPIAALELGRPPIPATARSGETRPVTERETIDDIFKTGSPAPKRTGEVDPAMVSGIDSNRGATSGESTPKAIETALSLTTIQRMQTPAVVSAPPSSSACMEEACVIVGDEAELVEAVIEASQDGYCMAFGPGDSKASSARAVEVE
ncbi:hypothetical protein BKA61DRAFT_568274 [Leptodontidium sp. MPI-SDFR-AT-0119]|nr:hypothetical protein BKA61DRAFT_568274 [Leptodontidium sp. MPI-SDFR-AT-0119]